MRNTIAKIACPGALADHLVIENERSSCGDVEDGISVRFDGTGGESQERAWSTKHGSGFVLSWPDFEAAYLKIKALREADSGGTDGA